MKVFILTILMCGSLFGQLIFEKSIQPAPIPEGVLFSAIAVSKFGDIYLIDSKFHEIYKVGNDGIVLKKNGGFGWNEGQFDTPTDICVSSGLDLLVTDLNNHRIALYDRDLNYITVFPKNDDDRTIPFPLSITATEIGEMFVLENENREVLKFNVLNDQTIPFAGFEYGKYSLLEPVKIRISSSGKLYVLEKTGKVLIFDRFGTFLTEMRSSDEGTAIGMTLIDENILIFFEGKFGAVFYSKQIDEWYKLVQIGGNSDDRWIAGALYGSKIYLLTQTGSIIVCEVSELK